MRPHLTLAAAAAIAVLCTLTACTTPTPAPTPTLTTSPTPTTTPTPTPTPTPKLSTKDQHIEDAKATFIRYQATSNRIARGGFEDIEAMLTFLGGREFRIAVLDGLIEARDGKVVQTGTRDLRSMTVTNYTASKSGYERVYIDVCIVDSDDYDLLQGKTSVIKSDFPDARSALVTMQHEKARRWVVYNVDWTKGKSC